ncbi:MAG: cyclic nucleotide-binding domain-containing protein [Desulfobacteraceae bacterium]|jgi:CRP-like cAMP-binding protein|nr:cyclic nucleotide-binding domain-containing protein [Desulfobacteraceae bacterium]
MDVQKAELLRGLSSDCITEILDIAILESYGEGDCLFFRGDPAGFFYFLLKGRVKLHLGETGKIIHHVTRPGEIIGWSGLVGREAYTASAECTMPTELHKIQVGKLRKIMEKNPVDGFVFYDNLSKILGDRLLQSYSQYEKVFVTSTVI